MTTEFESGYLSSTIAETIMRNRELNKRELTPLVKLNRLATKLIQLPVRRPETRSDPSILAAATFCRLVEFFQATILLLERGMAASAGSAARSCLETAFVLTALRKDPETVKKGLHAADRERMVKHGNALLNSKVKGLKKTERVALHKWVKDLQTDGEVNQSLNYEALAHAGEVDTLYLLYRHLSATATHTSFASLSRHLVLNQEDAVESLKLASAGDDPDQLWGILIALMATAISAYSQLTGARDVQNEAENLWNEYSLGLKQHKQTAQP